MLNEGKDLNNLLWEIIKYVKDILVYKVTKELNIYSEDELKDIKELSEKVTKERLLYMITDLSKLENDMKWSSQRSILFQVEIIKLCSDDIIEQPVQNVKKDSPKTDKTANNVTKKVDTEVKQEDNVKTNISQALSRI